MFIQDKASFEAMLDSYELPLEWAQYADQIRAEGLASVPWEEVLDVSRLNNLFYRLSISSFTILASSCVPLASCKYFKTSSMGHAGL